MTLTRFPLRAGLLAGLVVASGIAGAQPAPQAVPPAAPVFPMTDAAPRPMAEPRAGALPAPMPEARPGALAAPTSEPRPMPVAGPMGLPPAVQAQAQAQAQASVSGTLARWLINPNGEADGLLLQDGTQVSFPPHLSAELTALAQPGERIDVSGWRATGGGVLQAQQVSVRGRTVADQPPAPGAVPPAPRAMGALAAMDAGGRIVRVLSTGRGDVNGVLLEDGTIVRFPPHVGRMIGGLLQPGAPLYAQGWGTRSPLGTALEATRLGASPKALQDVLSGSADMPAARPGPVPGPQRRPV
ncbi:hypothetical protein [Pseudacidovorax sp. RU35E]|uniref:hypothetical protein n=1 Tax=Pseudacidovorax sp. RU35E TaxID=1907403 RepID=UPI0009556949|nr:hypothetical protein [Pseudacidovorax sp. RU35E]SIQ58372.1 hypothetical protein SAMN05880557_104348 [Pseudacidovorax sp. RU35E]